MGKRKVGLLTFSDGRKFAHDMLREMNIEFQNKFRARLEATGNYEVVAGQEIVWHPEVAKREGRRLLEAGGGGAHPQHCVLGFPALAPFSTQIFPGPSLVVFEI